MAKIQGEGPESKGGVNEGPATPRPDPPKGHVPEANNKGRAEPGQVEWPPPSLETSGLRPPVPSEDAGEKWGRLLYGAFEAEHSDEEAHGRVSVYEELSHTTRRKYECTARRFRDECTAPYKELEEAAGLVGATSRRAESATDEMRADWIVTYRDMMRLLNALPDQDEAAEDGVTLKCTQCGSDQTCGLWHHTPEGLWCSDCWKSRPSAEDKPRPSDEDAISLVVKVLDVPGEKPRAWVESAEHARAKAAAKSP